MHSVHLGFEVFAGSPLGITSNTSNPSSSAPILKTLMRKYRGFSFSIIRTEFTHVRIGENERQVSETNISFKYLWPLNLYGSRHAKHGVIPLPPPAIKVI